jgi:hypothetical protein
MSITETNIDQQSKEPVARKRMMWPSSYELFQRNGDIILRCYSPDAVGGIINLDRREPTGPALSALRRQGQYLARRYLVEFLDRTEQSIVLPEASPAPPAPASRPIRIRARSNTENAVRKRARAIGFYVRKSKRRTTATEDDRRNYMLVEITTSNTVMGARYDALLDDINSFLLARAA